MKTKTTSTLSKPRIVTPGLALLLLSLDLFGAAAPPEETVQAQGKQIDTELSITHLDISLKANFQTNRVDTVVNATLENTSTNSIDRAEFWLCPGMNDADFGADVKHILFLDHNGNQDLAYTIRTAPYHYIKHGVKVYQVRLPGPLRPGAKCALRFEYVMTGKPDFSSTPIEKANEGFKELYLRGEDWVWCPDLWVDSKPGDTVRRSTPGWTLALEYPEGYVAVADGELLRREAKGTVKDDWKSVMNGIPRLYLGQYKVLRHTLDGLTFEVYAADNELLQKAATKIELYARIFKRYSELFGDPGQRIYRIVGSTYAAVGAASFMGYVAPAGELAETDVIAHEMAHTWWGYLIDFHSPGFKFGEALAEFSARWVLTALGEEGYTDQTWNNWILNLKRQVFTGDYDAVAGGRTRTLFAPLVQLPGWDPGLVDLNNRVRGPLVLNHLRLHLTDEVFFRCLKAFVTKHRGTKVKIEDFVETVNAGSGREISSELKDLLWSTGYASYRLVALSSEKSDSGYRTKVTIRNDGVYGVACPLLLKMKTGEQRTEIKLEGNQQKNFIVLTPDQVIEAVIDPDLTAPQYHPQEKLRLWTSIDPDGNEVWHGKSYMYYAHGEYPKAVATISEYFSWAFKGSKAQSIEERLKSSHISFAVAAYVFMRGVYYLAQDQNDQAEADIKAAFPFMISGLKGEDGPLRYWLVGAIPEENVEQYQLLLSQIAGREFAFPAGADEGIRKRMVEEWTQWWEKDAKQKPLDLNALKVRFEAQRKAFCQREPSFR